MRLRLILLVVAISSMVLISFLVPLALVLRTLAADREVSSANDRAQSLIPWVSAGGAGLDSTVKQVNAADPTRPVTVFLPGGAVVGPAAARSAAVRLAADGSSFSAQPRRRGGAGRRPGLPQAPR